MKSALAACSLAMVVHSCAPPAIQGGFDSGNSASRMYAIENAARDGDQSAIRRIIEQLDSDDPAARSVAIAALVRLTGETYGYRDYDPRPLRLEAIARWTQAVESGELDEKLAARNQQSTESSVTGAR